MLPRKIYRLRWKVDRKLTILAVCLILKIAIIVYYLGIRKKSCNYLEEYANLTSIFDVRKPKSGSIFFLHTACNEKFFNKRDACAVEAVAKNNPQNEVFVLYTYPIKGRAKDSYLNAILSYKNVNFVYLNVRNFIKDTPIEKLFYQRSLSEDFVKEVLAIVTLYRYGGIYLDMDVIVLKNLNDLFESFIGFNGRNLSTSVMRFGHSAMEQNYAYRIMERIRDEYRGEFTALPFIFKSVQEWCDTKDPYKMIGRQCVWYKVFPKHYFYPISYNKSAVLYVKNPTENIFDVVKKSYAIHTYSKRNNYRDMPVASSYPYVNLAKKYCPRVMSSLDFI